MSTNSILVVDDDDAIRRMLWSILRHAGFDVDEAASGNAAITLLREKQYHVVVLDVMMGDGSGKDVLDVLASTRPRAKCVVVVSAASPAKIDELPFANVHATLRKPFDIHDLIATVRGCIGPAPPSQTRSPDVE